MPLLTLQSRRRKLQFGLHETRQNMSGDTNFSFQLVSTGVFWKDYSEFYKHRLSTHLSRKQDFKTALTMLGLLERSP